MKKENKYRCPHCEQVVKRESTKKWIKSYCTGLERYVRLQLVK